ncbi:glutathione S-transferase [Aspergillus heteromorphus CBS 117.55]|uniref:Glutathione S-transferase n=1 Tax=Aspergillus heteromorphus CBS 117.55 TaxID=1448321 RepID=A0A317WJX6_9EURO|nr:glutathione S-transferase [Aspergillus heteromorphus CBS 117.55]PWY86754.1 glutathione S-transferase [Aspergillus heteromorphus CBS 117.55]
MKANRGAKIVLHWLERSRAQRIMWLMEELNLEYTVQTFKRQPNGTAPPELKQIHPLGKSPLVSVTPPEATEPMVLAESGPILEYFLDHFGGADTSLIPARYTPGKEGKLGGETASWMRYRYFMHYAEGSLMSPIQVQLIMNAIKNAPVPFFLKPITGLVPGKVSKEFLDQELRTHFTFLETQLASAPDGGPFLCGAHLTAADIQMSIPVIAALNVGMIARAEYPRLDGYSERLQAQGAYRRAVEKIEALEGRPFVAI